MTQARRPSTIGPLLIGFALAALPAGLAAVYFWYFPPQECTVLVLPSQAAPLLPHVFYPRNLRP
jgi:hypothetical protein